MTSRVFRGIAAGIAVGLMGAALAACGGSSGGGGGSSTSATAAPWTWVGGTNAIAQPSVAGPPGVSEVAFTTAPSHGAVGTLNVNQPALAGGSTFPGGRAGAAGWSDSQGNSWMFGGLGFDSTTAAGELNDLWKYNSVSGQWTLVSGASGANNPGVYGTKGTASAANVPGSREAAITFTDGQGNLWLFGGAGLDSSGSLGLLNDLWKYSPSAGTWTWIAGSNLVDTVGEYGTKGTAAVGNAPGSRLSGAAWVDESGNFWLFGGLGYDSEGNVSNMNDLWEYSTSSGEWGWMGGSDTIDASGVYGTLKQAADGNIPGARSAASAVVVNGALWLIAGLGQDSAGTFGVLNDAWNFNRSTGQWTWFAGSKVAEASGTYGRLGVISASNAPGARGASAAWTDQSNIFLFGGEGLDSAGTVGALDDLWKLNTRSGKWVWIGGPNTANASGVYGTQGTPAKSNLPGARAGAVSFTDAHSNHFIMGGIGIDSSGGAGLLDDFWSID